MDDIRIPGKIATGIDIDDPSPLSYTAPDILAHIGQFVKLVPVDNGM